MTHTSKLVSAGILAMLTLSALDAKSVTEIPYAENINPSTIERTFYNKGFKDGKEIGIREGYAKAQRENMRALMKYKKIIEGYEAGKYLSKKGKVTPPRVYQKRSGNKVELVVKGCEIRGALSPSDILKLPEADESLKSVAVSSGGGREGNELSDGVYLSGGDGGIGASIARPTSTIKQTNTIVLPDTQFYRQLLRKSGTLFSIESGGGGLKAVFASPREKQNFVKNFGLEYGKDYQ